ncbi:hypothetical protein JCM6882_002292 [Rhodosporidiobolus microsporus]
MSSDQDSGLESLLHPEQLFTTPYAAPTAPLHSSTFATLPSSRTVPARSAKRKIGSMAETCTKDGGVRYLAASDGSGAGGRQRRSERGKGGGGGGGSNFKRDETGRFVGGGGRKSKGKDRGTARVQTNDDSGGERLPVSLLEDPLLSRSFGSMSLLDYGRDVIDGFRVHEETLKTIKVGDVVQVLSTGTYAVVEQISVPRDELHHPPTYVPANIAHSTPSAPEKPSTRRAYFKRTYFFPRAELEAIEVDGDGAFKEQAKVMGPNELIKTDNLDWKPTDIYAFDDSYPAPSPSARSGSRSTHPLFLYSPETLSFLSPSLHALPALSPPTRHPTTEIDAHLPPFFFGVGSGVREEEGRTAHSQQVDGGRDGRKGTPFARVGFCFQPQEAVKEEPGGDESEEEKKKKKGRKKRKVMKTFPLTFNPHSSSRTPYNPRFPQIYSPHVERWYNVDDLVSGHHYRRDGEEGGMKVGDEKKGDAGEDHPEIIDLCDTTPSSGSPKERSRSPSTTGAPSGAPSDDSLDDLALPFCDDSTLLNRLTDLWGQSIRRGGANGLTGNAFLVTRAGELLTLLSSSSASAAASTSKPTAVRLPGLSSSQRANALAEARDLLASAKKWERGVRERAEGKGEGRGLGREWRETGEAPPRGGKWVCPVTGRDI